MDALASPQANDVAFPGDDCALRGAFARAAAPSAPAVVLIPDVFGVSPLYRTLAGRLAGAGVHALVLDIYVRQGTPRLASPAAVMAWIASLDDHQILHDVGAAARWLAARGDVVPAGVGVLGFCLGGQIAFMAGCRIPELHAAVSFYGMLRQPSRGPHKEVDPLEMARDLDCPWLGHFGDEDALIPLADVEALRRALDASRVATRIEVYPGAGHAFLNEARPEAFRPEAAALAWSRTLEFLRATLGAATA